MNDLDESQQTIADTCEGMIVVDAGPGTGKTHTVVARCINILMKEDVGANDVVMLTFMKNAAQEMRDRMNRDLSDMMANGKIDEIQYREVSKKAKGMYIGTFDAYCLSIVLRYPEKLNEYFQFEETLTHNAIIAESRTENEAYFARFLDRFMMEHGAEYGDEAALLAADPAATYGIICRLMSLCIIPRTGGRWYGEGGDASLRGDAEKLAKKMSEKWKKISKQDIFTGHPEQALFDVDSPSPETIDSVANDPSRERLLAVLHDVYWEFIHRSIVDNHLTFGLVSILAFITLVMEGRDARTKNGCRYLIVDEFQDTNSNQLMISLMILREPNMCVVGDWKQGIFGFRYVSVNNILHFEERIKDLGRKFRDVEFSCDFKNADYRTLPLKKNYRSSQTIIDAAFEALKARATQKEKVPPLKNVVFITSAREEIGGSTRFETVQCKDRDDEVEEVLRTATMYVTDETYRIFDKNGRGSRRAGYGDIAVLCRGTDMCRRIYRAAVKHGIPAYLQGDVDIMNTREGKLALAWLRYINNGYDKWGYVPILADMGYSKKEIARMSLNKDAEGHIDIPAVLREKRAMLFRKRRRITDLLSSIFSIYGLDNDITQTIITELSSSHRSNLMTISDIINTIKTDIEKNTMYDIDDHPDADAMTIQTVHKSKGLEYPIVIIPGVDSRIFPSVHGDYDAMTFDPLLGVRSRNEVVEFNGYKKIGRSWRTQIAKSYLKKDYDEERRLMFVAVSRAMQYVTMIAGDNPSPFFKHFKERFQDRPPSHGLIEGTSSSDRTLIDRPEIGGYPMRRRNIGVHDILHFDPKGNHPDGPDEVSGKGMKYGAEVHRLARLMVDGYGIDRRDAEQYPQTTRVMEVVNGLKEEGAILFSEMECTLPMDGEDYLITLRGVIDMVAVFPDRVEIHDWKTDIDTEYGPEYRMQLSVYAHAVIGHLAAQNAKRGPTDRVDKKVTCAIDWLSIGRGTQETFEPASIEEIADRVGAYAERFKRERREGLPYINRPR